jgi:endonuclease I
LNGFIARALLYAAQTYKVDVGYPLGTLMKVSADNPASPWEMARNILINRYQRPYKLNPFITVPDGLPKRATAR